MNERDRLDELIEQELRLTLPEETTVRQVTPWREPVGRIVCGLALTGVTFNLLYLQYLLPALGVVLQYLGFRTLRSSGKAFRIAFLLSAARLVWNAVWLALLPTPLLPSGGGSYLLGMAGMALQIAQLLAFRAGLQGVFRVAGLQPESDPLRAAVLWQLAVAAIAFTPFSQSWLAGIPLLIAFVCIVRALLRVRDMLDEAGYCFVPAPVRISGGGVKWGYLLGCLAAVLVTSATANHPRLVAAPLPETPALAAERQALADLGLPQDVAAELDDTHVQALAGALYVQQSRDILLFGDGYGSTTVYDGTNEPDKPPRMPELQPQQDALDASTFYIELPENRMAVLVRFAWLQGAAYWGDAFSLAPDSDTGETLLGGALLYERDGVRYTAPVPFLADETVTGSDWFFGTQTVRRLTGAVCYPFGAKNQRGYVLYVMGLDAERSFGGTGMMYYHAAQPIHVPYRTPAEKTAGWTNERLQQHYSNFSTVFGRAWEREQE